MVESIEIVMVGDAALWTAQQGSGVPLVLVHGGAAGAGGGTAARRKQDAGGASLSRESALLNLPSDLADPDRVAELAQSVS